MFVRTRFVCQLRSKFAEWPFEIETQGHTLGQRQHRLDGAEQSKQMIITFVAQSINEIISFEQDLIDEHERNYTEDESAHDFIDVFLKEMKNQAGNENTSFTSKLNRVIPNEQLRTYSFSTEEQLIVTVVDLCNAGSETTSNSIGK